MANIRNLNITFVYLSSGGDISGVFLLTGVVDLEILDVVLIAVRPPPINFIKISDSFDSRKSFKGETDGSGGPWDKDNLEVHIEEDEGANSFRLDIRRSLMALFSLKYPW